jgi:dolichol-phosphate mannosyltransferase
MSSALVIIPTYNEIENIEKISRAVLAVTPEVDLLVVDDHSPDGTGQRADELAVEEPRLQVIHRHDKLGLGRAYIAGFQWALQRHYTLVCEMDADFSHRPEDLPRLLEAVQDADLVLGSRYIHGVRVINWPLSRLILSRFAGLYVQGITGMPFSDPTGGFKCFRREVLAAAALDRIRSNGYSFQIEMTHQAWMAGFRIVEVPIIFEERRTGDSKMNGAIIREALWMVWKIWLRAGLRRHPRVNPTKTLHSPAPPPT